MAKILQGKPIADRIKQQVAQKMRESRITPKMVVLLVGDDPASVAYAKAKESLGLALGVQVDIGGLPAELGQGALLEQVRAISADPEVDGLLVELPLPDHLNARMAIEAMDPAKDVDGLHSRNLDYVLAGDEGSGSIPATPQACIALIETETSLSGKKVAVVGGGSTVGRPLSSMLTARGATVTVCDMKTDDLPSACRAADIVIVAAGKPGLLTGSMVHSESIVIDAGINEVDGKIVGDVDFDSVSGVVKVLTPVPGGVGACTMAFMFRNLMQCALKRRGRQ